MSIDITQNLTGQLPAAAEAVAATWGLTGVLVPSEPLATTPGAPGFAGVTVAGQAVVAEFAGGALTLIAADEIVSQLMESPAAPADVAAALAPAVNAACLALGGATAATTDATDAKVALRRISALTSAAVVTLSAEGEVKAALAVGTAAPTDPAAPAAPAPGATAGFVAGIAGESPDNPPLGNHRASRLDLLRGVNMQATVELGRATMTINDLLALRNGAVIELDRSAGSPADLYVNGRLIAHGEVVMVDENYGLRILQVVSDEVG